MGRYRLWDSDDGDHSPRFIKEDIDEYVNEENDKNGDIHTSKMFSFAAKSLVQVLSNNNNDNTALEDDCCSMEVDYYEQKEQEIITEEETSQSLALATVQQSQSQSLMSTTRDDYNKSLSTPDEPTTDAPTTEVAAAAADSTASAPVQYQIYYSPAVPEQPPSSYTSNSRIYVWISVLAVLSHILYWYGPSVPPHTTSVDTWNEFLQQQLKIVTNLATTWIQVVQYVAFWSWQAIQQDWQRQRTPLDKDDTSSSCHQQTHPWASLSNSNDSLQDKIPLLGQDMALERLQTALQQWQPNKHTQANQQQQPLLVYATGGSSLGKQSLAYFLSQQLQQEMFQTSDCSTATTTFSDVGDEMTSPL